MEKEKQNKTPDNQPSLLNSSSHNNLMERMDFSWSQEIPGFGNKLLIRLNEFRKKKLYCDITLKTNDCTFQAHRAVLAACGGVFRSFPEENEKTNGNKVSEIYFSCPTIGIKTILNFAYTGKLEIKLDTLVSVFLAAVATETKEIQEISSELCLLKLGWCLIFDGTERTLLPIPKSKKDINAEDEKPTLEEANEMLHHLLKINLNNLNSVVVDDLINVENYQQVNKPDPDWFPCSNVIERKWPELKPVYVKLLKCLWKAKLIEDAKVKPFLDKSVADFLPQVVLRKKQLSNTNMISSRRKESIAGNQLSVTSTNKNETSQRTPKTPNPTKPSTPIQNQSISPTPRTRHTTKLLPPAVPPPPTHKPVSKSFSLSNISETTRKMKEEITSTKSGMRLPPPRPKPPSIQKR